MNLISLILCFVFSKTYFQGVLSDQSCQISEKPKLQVVLVMSYSLNRHPLNDWLKFQTETAKYLLNFITDEFPDTEFGLTGFLDYPDSANPSQRGILDYELCYFLMQEFTTEKSKILSAITKTNQGELNSNYYGDGEDSVTTALLFTAVEKKLKWNSGFYYSGTKIIRKIMVPFVIRNITTVLKLPGNRDTPKADGNDKCSTALPPTTDQLDKVLFDYQFAIINAILNIPANDEDHLTENHYTEEFARLFVPYYQIPFPAPGVRAEHDIKYDYRPYAKQIYDVLKREVMECDWEDPIGYNTLGL